MIGAIIVVAYLALSLLVTWMTGFFIRAGMMDLQKERRSKINLQSIKENMVEISQYDVTRHTVKYRWDYENVHIHDEFYCYSEPEEDWVKRKREEAALAIFKEIILIND